MKNQTLGLVDTHGKGILNVFEAQCAIDSLLTTHTINPLAKTLVDLEHNGVSHNHIDLDISGDIIDGSELHIARIFPKRTKEKSRDIAVALDTQRFEELLYSVLKKLFQVILYVLGRGFQATIALLLRFDEAIERFVTSLREDRTTEAFYTAQQTEETSQKEVQDDTQNMSEESKSELVEEYCAEVMSSPVERAIVRPVTHVRVVPTHAYLTGCDVKPVVIRHRVRAVEPVLKKHEYTSVESASTEIVQKERGLLRQVVSILISELFYGQKRTY